MENQSLYKRLLAAGIPIDNHESDLYFKSTIESIKILDECQLQGRQFLNQKDNSLWIEVPFMYEPWWIKRLE